MKMTMHQTRAALRVARAMLTVFAVDKYGGRDARRRTMMEALFGGGTCSQPARLRSSAASA
jgi:hypothetical protein